MLYTKGIDPSGKNVRSLTDSIDHRWKKFDFWPISIHWLKIVFSSDDHRSSPCFCHQLLVGIDLIDVFFDHRCPTMSRMGGGPYGFWTNVYTSPPSLKNKIKRKKKIFCSFEQDEWFSSTFRSVLIQIQLYSILVLNVERLNVERQNVKWLNIEWLNLERLKSEIPNVKNMTNVEYDQTMKDST